jgi:hypothetical protein
MITFFCQFHDNKLDKVFATVLFMIHHDNLSIDSRVVLKKCLVSDNPETNLKKEIGFF